MALEPNSVFISSTSQDPNPWSRAFLFGGTPFHAKSPDNDDAGASNGSSKEALPNASKPTNNVVQASMQPSPLNQQANSKMAEQVKPSSIPKRSATKKKALFKCPFPSCGRTYQRKRSLSNHTLYIHRTKKMYHCTWPGCYDFSTVYSGNMTKHIRRSHFELLSTVKKQKLVTEPTWRVADYIKVVEIKRQS